MPNSFDTEVETPELETISSLAQHLVYRLPECDDKIIRLTLREVYRDFCRRSCCLRVRRRFFGPFFRLPSVFGVPYKVTEVCFEHSRRRLCEERDFRFSDGCVSFPGGRGACCEVVWAEIPPLSSENAPRWFIDKYGDAICAGVLARLLAIANKPWSDPQMAAIEAQRYESMLAEACMSLYSDSPTGSPGTVFDTRDML